MGIKKKLLARQRSGWGTGWEQGNMERERKEEDSLGVRDGRMATWGESREREVASLGRKG